MRGTGGTANLVSILNESKILSLLIHWSIEFRFISLSDSTLNRDKQQLRKDSMSDPEVDKGMERRNRRLILNNRRNRREETLGV